MKYMRFELYAPDDAWRADEWRSCIAASLIALAGGLTVVPGNGWWVDFAGAVIRDPVSVVTTFLEDTEDNRHELDSLCQRFKEQSGEQSVLYVINSTEVHFI